MRAAIEATGATLLYLPAYSPDLNLIENVSAKIKYLMRKLAARTIDALWAGIEAALPKVTASDCANCFTHAGYR